MIDHIELNQLIEKPVSGEWGNDGDKVNVLRTTNFTNEGRIDYSQVIKRNIPEIKIKKKKLQPGDIIIEKSGGSPTQPVGRVVFFNSEGTYLCTNFTSVLRPKIDSVFPKYLLYILFCNHKYGITNSYQNKTTGIINLKLDRYVNKIKIPLPPLPIQKKIAAVLDAADALRQKDKALIDKYNELTQALFLDMFGDPVTNPKGWEYTVLDQVILKGPQNGLYKPSKFYGRGHPIVRIDSFYNDIVQIDNLKLVEVNKNELDTFEIIEGNFVINRVNSKSHLGKCGLMPHLRYRTVYESNMMRIEFNKKLLNNLFALKILSTKYIKNQILNAAKDAVNQSSINQKDVNAFKIPLPPIEIQNHFAERVEAIEKQKQQAEASLKKSEELFNSLLQRAFKGELMS